MRGQLTSELKAKWKFNDDSAPLHQTQIVSFENWPAHFVALICIERGHILLLCTPELLLFGGILLWLRNQREECSVFNFILLFFYYYYFWELMYICCGLKDHCVSMKKAVAELRLYLDIPLYPYTPWRNCWETVESMDWLLQSKSANDCVCMCASQPA